jgi:CubicO group peptidase (beta-lactamase class C family)
VETVLQPYVDSGILPGVVALSARGDDVVLTGAGLAPDSLFRLASLTKPIVAAAAMLLVEDGTLTLDAPVDPWLPELAKRPVLRSLGAEVDDVVPQARPITVRDVLTYTFGFGVVMAPAGTYPIQQRINDLALWPGPDPEPFDRDEYMARLGQVPMLHQPGQGWAYHAAGDVLAALLIRASGKNLETLLHERLFEPLGMKDTSFGVTDPGRLAPLYLPGDSGLQQVEEAPGRWEPPLRESGSTGLVSTALDLLAFGRMVLSSPALAPMTRDQLTPAEKAGAMWLPGFGSAISWGYGASVVLRDDPQGPVPGSYGWTGGTGTAMYTDLTGGRVNVLLTQRMMSGPLPQDYAAAFWQAVRKL